MNDSDLIWEAYKEIHNAIPTEKEVLDAAETQRGYPESQMMKSARIMGEAGVPITILNLMEHIGDLSHRAQERHSLINIDAKLYMVEVTMLPHRWSIEKEIDHAYIDNAKHKTIDEIPELKEIRDAIDNPDNRENRRELIDKLWKTLDSKYKNEYIQKIIHAKKVAEIELNKYTKAHELYNKPITTLGKLGKAAAIAVGKEDYPELRSIVKQMREWLNVYDSLSSEEEQLKMFLS